MKVLRKNGEIAEVNFEEQEGKKVFWHTSAHVLAQAVKRLYPETKCAVGSATENGFSYEIELSTRPEHSIGSDEEWQLATEALEQAVQGMGKSYAVKEGDGAFYGPKLDFHLKDSLGRTWQCGTIQLDFQLPQRFEIDYIGADGKGIVRLCCTEWYLVRQSVLLVFYWNIMQENFRHGLLRYR